MKQISFRGSSSGQGFAPIQIGQGSLSQMQQRDREVIRDIQQDQDRKDRINSKYISELEQKFNREERNRQELKRLEDATYDVRQRALAMNLATEKQSSQTQIQNIDNELKTWESLSNLSSTLGEELTKYKDQQNQNAMEEAYNEALMQGLPSEQQMMQANGEAQLMNYGESQEQLADGLAKRGTSPMIVNQVRSGNKWRDYGRLKAYAEMAASSYGGALESHLAQLGPDAMTPAGRAAAIQQFQMQYLKQNGLYGLSADFLGPMFAKMRTASAGLMENARKQQVVLSSEQFRDDARSNLYAMKDANAGRDFLSTYARSYDEDGRTIMGYGAARDALFKELGDASLYSDADVERILSFDTGNGQSFKDRFGREVAELIRKRREDAKSLRGLQNSERTEQGRKWQQESIDYLNGLDEIPAQALDELIKFGEENGFDTSQLEAMKAKTMEARDEEAMRKDFQRKFERGTLTVEELNDVDVSPAIRQEFTQRLKPLTQARQNAAMSNEEVKSALKTQLKQKLIGDSIDKSPDETLNYATADAMGKYNRLLKQFAAVDPSTAHEKALAAIRQEIESESGVFKVQKSSEGQAGQQRAIFPAFSPRAGGQAESAPDVAKFRRRALSEGTDFLDKELVVSKPFLESIRKQMLNGQVPQMPALFQQLAEASPDPNDDAFNILEKQFKAAGLSVPVVEQGSASSALKEYEEVKTDPKFQQLLKRPTTTNVNTTILGTTASGGWSSADSRGKALIAMATRNGWDPTDIAAIISFETGGTLNPNEPGRGAAAGRIGLIQAGPNERATYGLGQGTWNSEMAGIEKYLKDRGAKPGMGLEDLYSAVNNGRAWLGNKADGNGVVPRDPRTLALLEEHRQQATQRLGLMRTADNPTRNPNNMSPTLRAVYVSGNIGLSSTGPHLDVKRADGSYFNYNDLNEFVVVDDPELGRVPLGGVPETGDWNSHTVRGSHGRDYGLYSGTKIFLRNGARVVSSRSSRHGDVLTIKTPDGRMYTFLHGKSR